MCLTESEGCRRELEAVAFSPDGDLSVGIVGCIRDWAGEAKVHCTAVRVKRRGQVVRAVESGWFCVDKSIKMEIFHNMLL